MADATNEEFVTPHTVRLPVGVAAGSLDHDFGRKLRLWARASVPEYWVADVNGRQIIRFHEPAGEEYTNRATFAFCEQVPSATDVA